MPNKTDYTLINDLSPTQLEVVNLLCSGRCQKEIATLRGCSLNTVMQHTKRAREKLGHQSIQQMITAILNDRIRKLERELENVRRRVV